MNKENKNLNLALRILIIATWIMSNVSFFMLMTGMKNINTDGLDKDNVGERLFAVLGDFADKVSLYYVVLGMTAACLVLSFITRYKTTLLSFVFKLLALGVTLAGIISGLPYVGAIGKCKGLAELSVASFDQDSVEAALTAGGFSGNASEVAETLIDKDAAGGAVVGYIIPIMFLFILVITSIHCLVKRRDPNFPEQQNGTDQY